MFEQLSLNWQQQAIQPRELQRVRSNIGGTVLAFCRNKGVGARFHLEDLTEYVKARTGVAPDSPGRILRALRQEKAINYTVVDRGKSLYELTAIEDEARAA